MKGRPEYNHVGQGFLEGNSEYHGLDCGRTNDDD